MIFCFLFFLLPLLFFFLSIFHLPAGLLVGLRFHVACSSSSSRAQPEEAIEAAVRDLELQGYSLDLVVTKGEASAHPAKQALERLRSALSTCDAREGPASASELRALEDALRGLTRALRGAASEDGEDGAGVAATAPDAEKEALAALSGAGASADLVHAASVVRRAMHTRSDAEKDQEEHAKVASEKAVAECAAEALGEAARTLLGARHHQDEFAAAGGAEAFLSLLKTPQDAAPGASIDLGENGAARAQSQESVATLSPAGSAPPADSASSRGVRISPPSPPPSHASAVLRALCASGSGYEDGKVALVKADAHTLAADLVATHAGSTTLQKPNSQGSARLVAAVSPSLASAPSVAAPPSLASASHPAVVASCRLLGVVTTADDLTQPGSAAFAHARGLGDRVPGLVGALALAARAEPLSPGTAALAAALRRLLATEEICGKALEAGIADPCVQLLIATAAQVADSTTVAGGRSVDGDDGLRTASASLGSSPSSRGGSDTVVTSETAGRALSSLRAACALARALCASDSGKKAFVEGGGLAALSAALSAARAAANAAEQDGSNKEADSACCAHESAHIARQAAMAALGAAAACFLRNPDAADAAAAELADRQGSGAKEQQGTTPSKGSNAIGEAPVGGALGPESTFPCDENRGANGSAEPEMPEPPRPRALPLFAAVLLSLADSTREARTDASATPRAAAAPGLPPPSHDRVRVAATALRNAAARSRKAREALLAAGAEPHLRRALGALPPGDARDAVVGAIRDLGLD